MVYGNVEDFKIYITSRGKNLPLDLEDEKINSALLVTSEWLDSLYESIWIGYKTGGHLQERSWPRTNAVIETIPVYVYEKDEIPEQVIKATYEGAFREINKQGSLQVDFTPQKYQSVSVSGAVSVTYNSSLMSSSDVQIEIPVIQKLMEVLIDVGKTGVISSLSGKVIRV